MAISPVNSCYSTAFYSYSDTRSQTVANNEKQPASSSAAANKGTASGSAAQSSLNDLVQAILSKNVDTGVKGPFGPERVSFPGRSLRAVMLFSLTTQTDVGLPIDDPLVVANQDIQTRIAHPSRSSRPAAAAAANADNVYDPGRGICAQRRGNHHRYNRRLAVLGC